MELTDDLLDHRLAARLRDLRKAEGLTLEALAERTGVSRAMLSRIERGEASPTAALLSRLCAGLGLSISRFLEDPRAPASPLARHAEQAVWRDPESGYVRRAVTPPGCGSAFEIVEVAFPPRGRVVFDNTWGQRALDQQVWVREGILELTVDGATHRLEAGDCLAMRLTGPIVYANPGDVPVRYVVVVLMEPSRA